MSEFKIELDVIECAECSIHFAIPKVYKNNRLEDHKTFYCPNKHGNYYPGKSEIEKLSEKFSRLEQRASNCQTYSQSLQKSVASYKAHFKRLKNKYEPEED